MSEGLQPKHGADGTLGLLLVGETLFGVSAGSLLEVALPREIQPILSPEPAVTGAISLRGTLVPLLDPFALMGMPARQDLPGIAAVLTNEESMVALGVDGIAGLRRYRGDAVQRLKGDGQHLHLRGHLMFEDRIAHLLDVDTLFAQQRLPRAERKLRRPQGAGGGESTKHLVFKAGGVLYGVAAEHVLGTIPRQDIAERWLERGLVAGCIAFHGRRVPVIEAHALFGLGTPRMAERPEYVLVRMPKDRILALAVDDVCSIRQVPSKGAHDHPARIRTASRFLSGTIEIESEVVFVLDTGCLLADEALLTISELSDETVAAAGRDAEARPDGAGSDELAGGRVIHEKTRNIVFEAGSRFAAPIAHVTRLMEPPCRLTDCRTGPRGMRGLFLVDGKMTPLIDLASYLGLQCAKGGSGAGRVLLVGTAEHLVALRVEEIVGIADSDWRSRPEARMPGGHDLVQLRHRGAVEVVDRLDLDVLAAEIAARWHGDITPGDIETGDIETGAIERGLIAPGRHPEPSDAASADADALDVAGT